METVTIRRREPSSAHSSSRMFIFNVPLHMCSSTILPLENIDKGQQTDILRDIIARVPSEWLASAVVERDDRNGEGDALRIQIELSDDDHARLVEMLQMAVLDAGYEVDVTDEAYARKVWS